VTLAETSSTTDPVADYGVGTGSTVVVAYNITVSGNVSGDTSLSGTATLQFTFTYTSRITPSIFEFNPGTSTWAAVTTTWFCSKDGGLTYGASGAQCSGGGSSFTYKCTTPTNHFSHWGVGYAPAPAVVDTYPKSINKKSLGQYVTVYLEFPNSDEGPADVDVSTVRLQAIDPVTSTVLHVAPGSPTAVGDGNHNGIPDRMVKFDRPTVQGWFATGSQVTFRVDGKFTDNKSFSGTDSSVLVIDSGSLHVDESNHGSITP
jgi:hypothetical protein